MLAAALLLPLLASGSPWWEDYSTREAFHCGEQGSLLLERNDNQAALIAGNQRLTLFRAQQPAPGEAAIVGTVFRNEGITLILRGDQLIIERLPQRTTCMRTESA